MADFYSAVLHYSGMLINIKSPICRWLNPLLHYWRLYNSLCNVNSLLCTIVKSPTCRWPKNYCALYWKVKSHTCRWPKPLYTLLCTTNLQHGEGQNLFYTLLRYADLYLDETYFILAWLLFCNSSVLQMAETSLAQNGAAVCSIYIKRTTCCTIVHSIVDGM